MNKKLILKAGVIVALASLPLYASEKTEGEVALDACAQALAAKLENKTGEAVDYNINPDSRGNKKELRDGVVIYLDAKAQFSDDIIARANCIVNEDAEVTELVALPLTAPEARVRARKAY